MTNPQEGTLPSEDEEEFEDRIGVGSRHEEDGTGAGSDELSEVVLPERLDAPKNTSA